MSNPAAIARALHVLGVVIWIGGVAMVTTVILPAVTRMGEGARSVELFEAIEGRFTWIARAATVVVGATGFYLVHVMGLWPLFTRASHWWLGGMVAVWLIFTLVLFVLEPLVLHRHIHERGKTDPEGTLRRMRVMHWVLLTLSLTTAFGAVAGAHGWYVF